MAAVKVDGERKRSLGRQLKRLALLAAVISLLARYATLDPSKKRFIKHILKQVPYMPARYFA